MKDFTKQAHAKGWSLKALATRWQVKERAIQNWAAKPKQLHLDALAGVEDRNEKG